MLDFEAALARAEARAGVIPSSAATAIAAKCKAELFDVAAIAQGAKLAGNLAIPLVKALTALVAETTKTRRAMCTGARRARMPSTPAWCCNFAASAASSIARRSRPPGRTAWRTGDKASLDDCGRPHLDAAGAADDLWREGGGLAGRGRASSRAIARDASNECCVLQFGGAVGTLAALGDRGAGGRETIWPKSCTSTLPRFPGTAIATAWSEVATTLGLCVGHAGQNRARHCAARADGRSAKSLSQPEKGAADRRRCRTSAIR